MSHVVRIVVGGAMLVSWMSPGAVGVETTFDADAEGWTSTVPSEVSWASSDGNPGGYMRFEDASETPAFIIAPSSFHGDWSSYDGTGSITYDHKIFVTGTVSNYMDYEIQISGPGGSAEWIGPTPTGLPIWYEVVAELNEASWTVESGSWSALLADVTDLRIRIEGVGNPGGIPEDITGIDNVNVMLTGTVPTVSDWGMIVMCLLFVAAGTIAFRRMKGQPA